MKISKEDLLRVNQTFGGNLRSDSSIVFSLRAIENPKLGKYKKLAYLLRAIIVDHPFSDGNKRTAMFVAYWFANQYKKKVDMELLIEAIISIAKNNISEIRNIEYRMKNAIR